ncbi:hypothetical protein AAC387_Pa04g1645 [Persea americana]
MSLPFLPCFSSLCLLMVIFHIPTSNGEPAKFECNNTYNGITAANYTSNSIFHTNLKILLPSLSSNVSLTKGFYNTSIGEGSDKVYGLVLCRGDVPPDKCRNCTDFASADLLSRCQSRSSVIWYDLCQVQYSDTNFFDFSRTIWWFWVHSMINMTDSEVEPFSNSRAQLMRDLANKAAYEPWLGMFATGELNYTSTNNVYGLMQCKPVISEEDCHKCLEDAVSKIPECCDSSIGGRVVSEVCSLRFENSNFFGKSLVGGPAPSPPGTNKKSSRIIVFLIPAIAAAIILFIIVVVLLRKKKSYSQMRKTDTSTTDLEESDIFFHIDFEMIRVATDDFSEENKLGEGGFGPVYKGILPADGREIAVKRSLDNFIFDQERRPSLTWEYRFKIIGGIARGLLYLHEDSRLRIIHRDLKASNILLDEDMTPKISDFGLAKIFGGDQTRGSTLRIAGTFGYMAPEYVMHGQFSIKSDVFSFGVLLLEIVSGQKNAYDPNRGGDILSYVWKAWNDGAVLEVIDSTISENCSRSELVRCIHIGLLCVQEDPTSRPTMSSVALMLASFSLTLPAPSAPSFYISSTTEPAFQSTSQEHHSGPSSKKPKESFNDVSITELDPR